MKKIIVILFFFLTLSSQAQKKVFTSLNVGIASNSLTDRNNLYYAFNPKLGYRHGKVVLGLESNIFSKHQVVTSDFFISKAVFPT